MFSQGETVVYGVQGICKVQGTTRLEPGSGATEYYVLSPIYDENSAIYVPIDNPKLVSNMRHLLSAEEINNLILETDSDKTLWISDDLQRKAYCSEVIKSGDRRELMRLIGMLYLHQRDLKQTKKHFHLSDERYLKEAERLINDEFSYVLGIPREAVPDYIQSKIGK